MTGIPPIAQQSDGLPDFSNLGPKPLVPKPAPTTDLPDFSKVGSAPMQKVKQQEVDQGASDYIGNVAKNWIYGGGAKNAAINIVRFLDPLSQGKMAEDPAVAIAANDLGHVFDHVLNATNGVAGFAQEASQVIMQFKNSPSTTLAEKAKSLGMGMIKPIGDMMELSSGLQLSENDVRALTPEEKASRIKGAVALVAASAVAGPMASAIGVRGALAARILKGSAVGGVAGATYGGVAAANQDDQMSQILAGAVMGGTIGAGVDAIFPDHPKPADIAKVRQVQVENNSMASTAKVARAIVTSDDLAEAVLLGKTGLKPGEIVNIPGVDFPRLAALTKELPDGFKATTHVDKDGVGHLLVHDGDAGVDEGFYKLNGFVRDQHVSYDGSANWKVVNGDGKTLTIQDLSHVPSTEPIVNPLPNEAEVRARARTLGYPEQAAVDFEYERLKIPKTRPPDTPGRITVGIDAVRQLPEVKIADPSFAAQKARFDDAETLTGVAARNISNPADVVSQQGFDGGHESLPKNTQLSGNYEQGFITSKGRFVGRDEAKQIAQARNQLRPKSANTGTEGPRGLIAEDVQPANTNEQTFRNMMETGFAGGKSATMVELPTSGAGRAGSTATAMKQALAKTSPKEFRALVNEEIARRGGATSPEVEMAATEEVARKLASNVNRPTFAEWAADAERPQESRKAQLLELKDQLVNMQTVRPEDAAAIQDRLVTLNAELNQIDGLQKDRFTEDQPKSILERNPDVHDADIQNSINKFTTSKQLDPDQAASVKRDIESHLAAEVEAKHLLPEERTMVQDARSARVRELTTAEKKKSSSQLVRFAKTNGMDVTDGGSGRVIVRDLQTHKILAGFDSNEEAAKFISKSGQASGVDLDQNGTISGNGAGGGGGLPPNAIEGHPEYPSDGPYNFFTRAKNFGKALFKEDFIRGLDNGKLWTRNREFLLGQDRQYGTRLHEMVMENTQKYRNIRDGLMAPHIDKVGAIMKRIGKMSEPDLELAGKWMNTMSPDEVIARAMPRKMNPLEIDMAQQVAKSGVDVERIFKYSNEFKKLQKEFGPDVMQADPTAPQRFLVEQANLQKAFAIDPTHISFMKRFDMIEEAGKKEASLGAILRLARSITDNEPTQAQFAAKNNMSMEQMGAATQLQSVYKDLAGVFNLPATHRLETYMTHARLYTDGNLSRAMDHFPGDIKGINFFKKVAKTGEISPYEMNPIRAALRYIKGGFDVTSGFHEALEDARFGLKEELKKMPEAKVENTRNVAQRYLNDLQGFPEAGDRAAQESVNYIMDKYKLGEDLDVRNAWVNATTSTFAAAGLGMRPMLGIGHFGISTIISTAARDMKYTARVLKEGARALRNPALVEEIQRSEGAFSSIAPFANVREPGLVASTIDKAQDVLFKSTLLPTAYDGFSAGHYLVAKADALAALTKFNREEISWAQVRKQTFLDRFDQPVIRRFTELARTNAEDAANYLGVQAINDLVGVYSGANHPYGWGSNVGRIAGQFGNFAMWARSTIQRMASRGTVAQRIGTMAKLTAMSYGVGKIGEELGVDLNRMNPYHAMAWLFGPAIHIAEDAVTTAKGSGYAQEAAQRRLLKLIPYDPNTGFHPSIFVPGSFAVDGLIKAADDFSRGNTGRGIMEATGFRPLQSSAPTP